LIVERPKLSTFNVQLSTFNRFRGQIFARKQRRQFADGVAGLQAAPRKVAEACFRTGQAQLREYSLAGIGKKRSKQDSQHAADFAEYHTRYVTAEAVRDALCCRTQ